MVGARAAVRAPGLGSGILGFRLGLDDTPGGDSVTVGLLYEPCVVRMFRPSSG